MTQRQLDAYPDTGPRVAYLGITVLATVTLYYELYVLGSVSTLLLTKLHMSFSFLVVVLAVGNLVGAFGSLFAGLTDRLGRTNLVVVGLLFTGVLTAFVIPTATSKWPFAIEYFIVGLVEGICLVATPALIRDFSPQTGRATAMGFWTSGPVLGSLIVAVVASHTIGNTPSPSFWTHEFHIAGIAGLVVFVICLVGMRELSPGLRDQLMVSMRDRALVEARAKGIDIEEALRSPFRQLLHADVIISAIGVSVMLLIYYTAVGFGVIYFSTVFGFSVKDANGLGNWNWGFNVIAVILVGVVSDKLRVRKPFMIVGGAAAALMVVLYLLQAGHHTSYYHLAILLALLSFTLGVAYTPWMASFTETVEARNPALTATGLAIWGWIIRIVIFVSYLILPHVITTTSPLVDFSVNVPAQYQPALTFAQTHPQVVATAQKYQTQLANAQRFAPELAGIQKDPATFLGLSSNPNDATLQAKAIQDLGGGSQGVKELQTIASNQAAIQGVVAVASQLQTLVPYTAQLTALSKVPAPVIAYATAHGAAVTAALHTTSHQWKTWYWICFGGIIFFLLCVPLLKGRWSPKLAKQDEDAHEAMVQAELAKLGASA